MESAKTLGPLIVPPERAGERVDAFVASEVKRLSRSRAQKLIEDGNILVNGRKVRVSRRLAEGDEVAVTIPRALPSAIAAEDIPLDIVFEDDLVMVINKPAGMVVHPAVGNYAGTLVHALLFHRPEISGVGSSARPGIVHRLDKDTSGLILVAKTDEAYISLTGQIMDRSAGREYLAIVKGRPGPMEGVIEVNIGRSQKDRKKMAAVAEGGRHALTRFRVEALLEGHSLLRLTLGTGRTHQIRAHMLHINCPVLGDAAYGRKTSKELIARQALHAWRLSFNHPVTGERIRLTQPMPEDMATALTALGGDPAPYLAGR
jgi:23S rRNA pseudouridine1911/1915/1917 synthase